MTQNNGTFQPDPAWDYYEIWQRLNNIKNKIESGLKFISGQELADDSTDEKLVEILEPALEELEEVIENDLADLTDYADEYT